MKLLYILTVMFAISVLGCKSKADDPAPAAPDLGMIKGNLYYIDEDGKDVTIGFEYNYFSSDSINKYFSNGENGYYKINLLRQQINNDGSYLKFNRLVGFNDAKGLPLEPKETGFSFSLNRLVNDKQYRFYGFFYSEPGTRSTCTITNFSFNNTTHKLAFDFEADFHPDDIDFGYRFDTTTRAKIKGSVSVTLEEKDYF